MASCSQVGVLGFIKMDDLIKAYEKLWFPFVYAFSNT